MRQNTKFLWIYILILFSFALILIIFAGLSHNTEDEQQKGLKQDITELSQKNTELSSEVSSLQTQVDSLTAENTAVKTENESLKNIDASEDENDALLVQALQLRDAKKTAECHALLETIDSQTLTEIQLYIYNDLKNN